MRVQELKLLVRKAFGEHLEHATPANVREFLDNLQKAHWQAGMQERAAKTGNAGMLDLTESASEIASITWESEVRGFFDRSLDQTADEAVAALWLFAFEMAYFGIEEINAHSIGGLFE